MSSIELAHLFLEIVAVRRGMAMGETFGDEMVAF